MDAVELLAASSGRARQEELLAASSGRARQEHKRQMTGLAERSACVGTVHAGIPVACARRNATRQG